MGKDSIDEYRQWAMDDIIFENRNKAYGGYQLRKVIAQNVLIGLTITLLGFVVMLTPFYFDSPSTTQVPEEKEKITPLKPAPPKLVTLLPPPVLPPPALPPLLPPPVRPSVRFTEMVVKEDPDMYEEETPQLFEEQMAPDIEVVTNVGDTSITLVEKKTPPPVVKQEPVVDTFVYETVDQSPEFPGGEDALADYIQSHIRYPDFERSKGMEGTVLVMFVVREDGTVSDVSVPFGVSRGFDKEALRLIKTLPPFRPGRLNGRAVRVRYHIPVSFDLKLI